MEQLPSRREIVWLAVACEGGLALFAWLLGWLVGEPALSPLRLRPGDFVLGVAATVPALFAFLVCVRWPVGPLRSIQGFSEAVIRPLFAQCSFLDLLLIAALAGVGEEMLFRGVLQPLLGRWLGVWGGLVAASVLFGLLHPITPSYAVLAALMGAYLGLLLIWSDSLTSPILVHGLYDLGALLWLVHGPADAPAGPPESITSPSASAPTPPPP